MKEIEIEKRMAQNFFILDNIISKEQNFKIYNQLVNTPSWHLSSFSDTKNNFESNVAGFPGFTVEDNDVSSHHYYSGYFHALIEFIKTKFQQEFNFSLPREIRRIRLGAKNSKSETVFHTDNNDPLDWSILGFLTPVWKLEDGGEVRIEQEKIDYKPGRFILFKSHLLHNGGYIKNNNLDYWRISLNIVLCEKTSKKI
jgi:hypothetical protein